jgi:hypothetical protein
MSKKLFNEKEIEIFSKIKNQLFMFADDTASLNKLKNKKNWKDVEENLLQNLVYIEHFIFEKNRKIIDEFINQNKNILKKEELEILKGFKSAVFADFIYLLDYKKNYNLFYFMDDVYAVYDLFYPLQDSFKNKKNMFCTGVLVPFKNKIVPLSFVLPVTCVLLDKDMDSLKKKVEEKIKNKQVIYNFDEIPENVKGRDYNWKTKREKLNVEHTKKLQGKLLEKFNIKEVLKEFEIYDEKKKEEGKIYVSYDFKNDFYISRPNYKNEFDIVVLFAILDNDFYYLGSVRVVEDKYIFFLTFNGTEFSHFTEPEDWIEKIKFSFEHELMGEDDLEDDVFDNEEEFDRENLPLISSLFKPKNEVIEKNLKSIYNRERDYMSFLIIIEDRVIDEYKEFPRTKDKKIINYLKNLMENLDKDIDYFDSDFEADIYEGFVLTLMNNKITEYELKLCIKHVLWAIDNRSWMNNPQAYVKWLAYFHDEMDEREKKKYRSNIKKMGREMGLPKKEIDMILNNDYENHDFPEYDDVQESSEFFNLSEDEKIDFILNDPEENFELGFSFLSELIDNDSLDKAEKLAKVLYEVTEDNPALEVVFGEIYIKKKNKHLARFYLESAMKKLEHFDLGDHEIIPILKGEIEALLRKVDNM